MSMLDDFKARFPAFDTTYADTYVPIYEGVYTQYYNFDYSDDTKEAILNLVAHLIVVETSSGNSPSTQIVSKSVGGVSASYSALTGDAWFNSTRYGVAFLRLTQHTHGAFFV